MNTYHTLDRWIALLQRLGARDGNFVTLTAFQRLTGLEGEATRKALRRLEQKGYVNRVGTSLYANKFARPTLEELAMLLGRPCYVSCESALERYGILSQMPLVLTCVSTSRSQRRHTPLGDIVFHRLPDSLFFGYRSEEGILWAEPEKALLDWLYIQRKTRGAFPALDELDLGRLDHARLAGWSQRYPRTVATALPTEVSRREGAPTGKTRRASSKKPSRSSRLRGEDSRRDPRPAPQASPLTSHVLRPTLTSHVPRPTPSPSTSALREIARALAAASDLDSTLDLFARKTTEVLGVDSCSIYLLDPETTATSGNQPSAIRNQQAVLRLRASTGLARAAVGRVTLRMDEGLTGQAALLGQPQFARDAQHDPRFKLIPDTHEKSFRSLLAVPMLNQGRIIGAINVQTRRFHDFTPDEIELLSLVGDLAAGALVKASLHDSMRRQLDELTALARVSEAVTSPIYLDEMLDVVTEMAATVMKAGVCSVFLMDEAGENLVMHSARRASRAYHPRPPVPMGQGIAGQVAQTGKPIAVLDVRSDARYLNPQLARQEGLVSLLSVPLSVRDRVIGVLNCYTGEPHEFAEGEIALFSTLANQTALAIENARLVTNAAVVREMHHRIKNNLQTVAMLLRMQIGDGRGLDAREVLQESVNRILSIAAVHEVLSEQGFRLVDVKDVVERIAHSVAQNMIPPGLDVRIAVEGQPVVLPSRAATSLALVVNELLQNAIEHAFVGRERGQVRIALTQTPSEIVVEVADDGVGWQTAPDQPRPNLGLEIVETLAREDLKGKLQFKRDFGGTQAIIRLPRATAKWGEE